MYKRSCNSRSSFKRKVGSNTTKVTDEEEAGDMDEICSEKKGGSHESSPGFEQK